MKTNSSLKSILAGIGAVSLLIYVLACSTSFSPDDRQVIYPAYDPQSGATCVALYDRKTGRSETLFTAAETESATNQHPLLLRAEWLPDGKHILIGQLVREDGLLLTVLPREAKEPVRNFIVPDLKDAATSLEFPFAIAGSMLVLNCNEMDPVRVNLVTGEVVGGEKSTNQVVVMPSPDGKTLVGSRAVEKDKFTEFGTFDPKTMEFKPLASLPEAGEKGTMPVFNPADGRVVFIEEKDGQLMLKVAKDGKDEFSRPLIMVDAKLEVGTFLDIARDGKTVFTAACSKTETGTNSAYGLLEIPLNGAPLRFTPLFHIDETSDNELMFAQSSLSHDGTTWAIATSYLYRQNKSLRAEDSALFLVDVSKAKRPVTKISIPVPPERKKLL